MREYLISDVSKLLGIEPHVLRYWEEELNLEITRNKLGHRYYDEQDLEVLKKIREYKDRGFQLKAIKVLLNHSNQKEEEVRLNEEGVKLEPKEDKDALRVLSENISSTNQKLLQFQEFLKSIITTTLKENNDLLMEDIRTEVKSNFNEVIDKQEALDEKRFRKLDETIREMQKMRHEAAVTEHRRNPFMKKRISP